MESYFTTKRNKYVVGKVTTIGAVSTSDGSKPEILLECVATPSPDSYIKSEATTARKASALLYTEVVLVPIEEFEDMLAELNPDAEIDE